MFKYVVTWVILQTTQTPCPKPTPIEDDYGRVYNMSNIELANICFSTDTIFKRKEFNKRQDAVNFINNADTSSPYFWIIQRQSLANFKLDSLKIK